MLILATIISLTILTLFIIKLNSKGWDRQKEILKRAAETKGAKVYTPLWSTSPRLSFNYKGTKCQVYPTAGDEESESTTLFTFKFPTKIDHTLLIKREGAPGEVKLGIELSKTTIGDPKFEKKFLIRSSSPAFAAIVLNYEITDTISEYRSRNPWVFVNSKGGYILLDRMCANPQSYEKLIEFGQLLIDKVLPIAE